MCIRDSVGTGALQLSDEQNGGARHALPSADATFMQRVAAALALSPPVSLFSMFRQIPEHTPAVGESRLKVAVLTGCVQRLSFGDVNRATVNVLAAEGCTVAAPATQGCCGALPLHAGGIEQARRLARHNIEVFEAAGVERIVVNAAGCGSAMKAVSYTHLTLPTSDLV